MHPAFVVRWHMKFSGEAQLPDAGNNVLVHLIQEDCVHSCREDTVKVELLSPYTLVYKGPYYDTTNDDVVLHMARAK
jgi:hypothetical protein